MHVGGGGQDLLSGLCLVELMHHLLDGISVIIDNVSVLP